MKKLTENHLRALSFANRAGDITFKDLKEAPFNFKRTVSWNTINDLVKLGFLTMLKHPIHTKPNLFLITLKGFKFLNGTHGRN